jgi:hypothetical protein
MGCFKDWARFVILIGQSADRVKKNVAVLFALLAFKKLGRFTIFQGVVVVDDCL